MKEPGASQSQSASELISKRTAELGDWRGETLSRMRKLIQEAVPDVVEEWKWMGTPVWSRTLPGLSLELALLGDGQPQLVGETGDGLPVRARRDPVADGSPFLRLRGYPVASR